MGGYERTVLAELKNLREAEAALEGMYEKLCGAGTDMGKSFMASLKMLDERVNRLESFLERAA